MHKPYQRNENKILDRQTMYNEEGGDKSLTKVQASVQSESEPRKQSTDKRKRAGKQSTLNRHIRDIGLIVIDLEVFNQYTITIGTTRTEKHDISHTSPDEGAVMERCPPQLRRNLSGTEREVPE